MHEVLNSGHTSSAATAPEGVVSVKILASYTRPRVFVHINPLLSLMRGMLHGGSSPMLYLMDDRSDMPTLSGVTLAYAALSYTVS